MALQVWLPFIDGTLTNNGLKNLTLTSNSTSVQNNGKLGKCLSFNGSSSIITSTEKVNIIGNTSYTIAFWMYWAGDTWINDYVGIVGWGQMSTNQGAWAIIHNGKPDLDFWNRRYEATTQLQVKRWYHITMVKTPGDMSTTSKLYVDGQEVSGTPSSTETPSIVDGTLLIGRLNNSSTRWFNGYLNDIRIYDEALSPLEIKRISQGLIAHYPLNDPYIETTTNLCNVVTVSNATGSVWGNHTVNRTAVDASSFPIPVSQCMKVDVLVDSSVSNSGGNGWTIQSAIPAQPSTTYTYSGYFKANDDFAYTHANLLYKYEYSGETWSGSTRVTEGGVFNKSRMISVGGGWYRCWGTFTTSSTTNWLAIYFYTYPGKNVSYLVGAWQLEQNDHMTPYVFGSESNTTIYDISGYKHNGTRVGTLTLKSDSARYLSSTFFKDYTSYISCSLEGYTPDQVTMSCWVKTSNTSPRGGYHIPFNVHSTDFEISITGSSGKARLGYVVGGTRKVQDVGPNIQDGKWHMLSSTYDGSAIKRYVDGVLVHTENVTGALSTLTTIGIGNFPGGTSYGNTEVYQNDCRLYVTALSADDIKQLYEASAYIATDGTGYAYEFVEE